MPVAFTQYYGTVLDAAQARSDLVANNIANVDTPGFKARDISFDDTINAQLGQISGPEEGTSIPLYRAASTVTLDGNDVSLDSERLESAQTAERIQSVSTFLRQSTADLITALRPNPSGI
jgi:flagellar basal-body rod protein FlgB